jgi:hypothetical protein
MIIEALAFIGFLVCLSANPQWDHNCFLMGISLSQPLMYGVVRDVLALTPINQGERFSVVGKKNIVSLVSVLCFRACPNTIFGEIPQGVIFSFDTVLSGGLRTHVFKEITEAVYPPITYSNPSPPVAFVVNFFGIVASGFHRCPSHVFRGIAHVVSSDSRDAHISFFTPARFDRSIANWGCKTAVHFSTNAFELPDGFSKVFNGCEIAKSFS